MAVSNHQRISIPNSKSKTGSVVENSTEASYLLSVGAAGKTAFIDKLTIGEKKIFEDSVINLVVVAGELGVAGDTVNELLRETAGILKERQPRGRGLTESEARFLVGSGAFTQDEFDRTEASVANGELAKQERETRLGTLARTLTADQVAERLGIDASRVRHRQAKNNLFAFLSGRTRLYPTWQFAAGADTIVPHLAAVVDAFPEGWHPASIEGFMTTPQRDLPARIDGAAGDDAYLTPVEWLVGGGNPDDIVRILEGIRRW